MYREMKKRSVSLGALAATFVICALCLLLVSGAEQALGAKVRTFVEEVPESCFGSAYLPLRFGISFPAQPTIELFSHNRYR